MKLVPLMSTTAPALPLVGEKLVIDGAGGVGALPTVTNLATDGTPAELSTNSM